MHHGFYGGHGYGGWGGGCGGGGLGLLGYGYGYPGFYASPPILAAPAAMHMTAQPADSSSAHGPHSTRAPPPLPSYAERARLFQHRYGLDPDLVFNLWEHQGANSWCGTPGPACPSGSPVSVACAYGGVPGELTDVYTVEQWITLRLGVEQLHKRYQFHVCPLFCTFLCCVPCCLDSAFNQGMSVLLAAENQRLAEQGLVWDWDSERNKLTVEDTRTSGYSGPLRLLCPLKVQPKERHAFEQLHPLRRRILGTPYGHILYASVAQHVLAAPTAKSAEPSTPLVALEAHAGRGEHAADHPAATDALA